MAYTCDDRGLKTGENMDLTVNSQAGVTDQLGWGFKQTFQPETFTQQPILDRGWVSEPGV